MIHDKRRSKLSELDELLIQKLNDGYTYQSLYEYLKSEHGYQNSYQALWQYIQRLQKRNPVFSSSETKALDENSTHQIPKVTTDEKKELQDMDRKAKGRALLESIASKPKKIIHEVD